MALGQRHTMRLGRTLIGVLLLFAVLALPGLTFATATAQPDCTVPHGATLPQGSACDRAAHMSVSDDRLHGDHCQTAKSCARGDCLGTSLLLVPPTVAGALHRWRAPHFPHVVAGATGATIALDPPPPRLLLLI